MVQPLCTVSKSRNEICIGLSQASLYDLAACNPNIAFEATPGITVIQLEGTSLAHHSLPVCMRMLPMSKSNW